MEKKHNISISPLLLSNLNNSKYWHIRPVMIKLQHMFYNFLLFVNNLGPHLSVKQSEVLKKFVKLLFCIM